MASNLDNLLQRYANAASGADGQPVQADVAEAWKGISSGMGRLGAAQVRDSARRRWMVEAHRDRERGRFLVVKPVHGDTEPFRASADGHRPDAYLRISRDEWSLLALLAWGSAGDEGRADDDLRAEAYRLVSRLVIEAQHAGLMGAAEDEDD